MASRTGLLVVALAVLAPVVTLVSGQQAAPGEPQPPLLLEQGWTPAQRQTWYGLPQGSRLIPLEWLQALEQADSTEPFLSPQHIGRFRYLPTPAAGSAAPALPVGFAIDAQSDEHLSDITRLRWRRNQGDRAPWVGMNCAACHTNELSYHSLRLRIEGAPAIADFQGFMNALNRALEHTRDDAAKWRRFSAQVLGSGANDEDRAMLAGEFAKFLAWQARVEKVNQSSLPYGFARLDAFGHIYNKVLLRLNADSQPFNPSDAPVSYPFLWNIHQHDRVQWNGAAPNAPLGPTLDIGALARNVGEVIGVFADVTVLPVGPALRGYPNSANIENLLALEHQISQLKPPNWPSQFPPIDADKWELGRKLFHGACARCHADDLPRDNLTRRFKVTMTPLAGANPIGTDPWMACNAYTYAGNTGVLKLTAKRFFPGLPLHGSRSPASDLLGTVVLGSIWNRGPDVVGSGLQAQLKQLKPFDLKQVPGDVLALSTQAVAQALSDPLGLDAMARAQALSVDKAARLKTCLAANSPLMAYKGRPLVGIWATAPFLHNGSVPTLYDLLLPPADRPKRFGLGTREFDPEKVGYVNEHASPAYRSAQAMAENTFTFQVADEQGAAIAGNSNLGHDYGNAAFSDAERWALVEYMKAANARRVGSQVLP